MRRLKELFNASDMNSEEESCYGEDYILLKCEEDYLIVIKENHIWEKTYAIEEQLLQYIYVNEFCKQNIGTILVPDILICKIEEGKTISGYCLRKGVYNIRDVIRETRKQCIKELPEEVQYAQWVKLLYVPHLFSIALGDVYPSARIRAWKVKSVHATFKNRFREMIVKNEFNFSQDKVIYITQGKNMCCPKVMVKNMHDGGEADIKRFSVSDLLNMRIDIRVEGIKETVVLSYIYIFYLYPVRLRRISSTPLPKKGR